MVSQLVVIAGPDKGRLFVLVHGQPLLLGRGRATETRLADLRVSRLHCEVQADAGHVIVRDSNSAGGTFVNGKRVTRRRLRAGDVLQIGDTQLRLEEADIAEQSTMVQDGLVPPRLAASAEEPPDGLAGQTLSHFEVGQVLAKGRSGTVYKAHDTRANRTIALKILEPEFAKNDAEVQRFIRSMKTALNLRHPNLVSLHGAGKTGRTCWVAMEYVEGESLTQVIQRIGVAGMLDWRHALRVAIHIALALDYAHRHQIIHRNIAPPNILIRNGDGVAKLGDLMLAKALEGTLARQLTRPGELLGDVNYMSPERTRGATDVDGRSDIYNLGATVYALLTGRPPFADMSLVETVTKIRKVDPERPRKFQMAIPEPFEAIVLRMLAKRPEDRYPTAADLLADLERVARAQGVPV
jgi:serine/threonine protein kinase